MLENRTDDELLLHDDDFPKYYKNKEHPDDYLSFDSYAPQIIYHKKSHHNRLIFRVPWKINDKYVPVSYVCDTGAPMYLYLNKKTRLLLDERIKTDELDYEYVEIEINDNIRKIPVAETPMSHPDINIIGLCLLNIFELQLKNFNMCFNNAPDYF